MFIAALLVAAAPVVRAEGQPKAKELIDFTVQEVDHVGSEFKPIKKYDYAYEDWKDKITFLKGRGLLIPAVPGKGVMGGNKDLSLANFNALVVVAVIGNRNEADSIAVTLIDSDGTEATWWLQLAGKPVGTALAFRLDLAKPDQEEKPGKTPGLNKAKIKKWQIKGNWQTAKAEVLLAKLVASP